MATQHTKPPVDASNQEIIVRAVHAYHVAGRAERVILPEPSHATSTVELADGHKYAVLRDEAGSILAMFRHRNDGLLRRLRRYPMGLRENSTPSPTVQ